MFDDMFVYVFNTNHMIMNILTADGQTDDHMIYRTWRARHSKMVLKDKSAVYRM